jgi:hypothetical protein
MDGAKDRLLANLLATQDGGPPALPGSVKQPV